jgi:hypothetical protein
VSLRGLGDRWLAGDAVDGVAFLQHARVSVIAGARLGAHGTVMLLLDLEPEPVYLVALDSGSDVKVRQSSLRALA